MGSSNTPETNWPAWWMWELELSVHLLKRMIDRDFSEVDLRRMLDEAGGFHPDTEAGRWAIQTKHDSKPWEVIVEPDESAKLLVVITAYSVIA